MSSEPDGDTSEVTGQAFASDIQEDPLARKRAEIMVIAFGGTVRPDPAFVEAQEFQSPSLFANGGPPMAQAIIEGAPAGFLNRLSLERPAAALRDLQLFNAFFAWLTKSMSAVSLSGNHGSEAQAAMRTESIGQTPLPDPTGPSGWMKV